MHLGINISLIRKKWRFGQEEFGALLEVAGSQIGNYESGRNFPRVPALKTLVEITGIPFYDMCVRTISIEEIPDQPLAAGSLIQSPSLGVQQNVKVEGEFDLLRLFGDVEELKKRMEEVEGKLG